MVSSLDGFIAKKDGTVSWMKSMNNYENGVVLTNEYITEFLSSIIAMLWHLRMEWWN
ncbi:hypothetical protein MTsPCn5_30630 [Croceitalea sp. MTPC5]|nr:hypothetical protein MTsPCn5_30630 [Croceitalea sp. MTPC5]